MDIFDNIYRIDGLPAARGLKGMAGTCPAFGARSARLHVPLPRPEFTELKTGRTAIHRILSILFILSLKK